MKTVLTDRTVWFDGEITVKPSSLFDFIDYAEHLNVTEMTNDIKQYNRLSASNERISVKTELNKIDNGWMIPDEYKTLNVLPYILNKLEQLKEEESLTQDEYDERLERAMLEFKEFQRLKLIPLLRTLIYIINTFEQNEVVWGPGRGSSVSSYMLYLIGVHDVDSVTFDLNISDFMKDIQ